MISIYPSAQEPCLKDSHLSAPQLTTTPSIARITPSQNSGALASRPPLGSATMTSRINSTKPIKNKKRKKKRSNQCQRIFNRSARNPPLTMNWPMTKKILEKW